MGSGSPSLKKRLLVTLLLPLCAILILLGFAGAWLAQQMVQNTSDRVLSGSLQAIGETLTVDDGHLTLDLPPSALGMLENADRDNVYYSITYNGHVVTGYPELSSGANAPTQNVRFRNGTFHGVPIRIAMQSKLVPELDLPVVVQVAETVTNRSDLATRMLEALTTAELFLLVAVAILVASGIDWGLRPLAQLQHDIEKRAQQSDVDFAPLPLLKVPRELVPFVSAFNTLLVHVATSVETLKRFTSDASHQLRTPLTVIRTHVELLSRSASGRAEFRDPLADIGSAIKSLQRLIVQLISMAKADRPAEEEAAGVFDLVECSAAVARAHATFVLAANMDISFECQCDSLIVNGSEIFASEMVSNLLDNAVRYGNPGGHIVVRVLADSTRLEVEDDGPGLPPEEFERVFERFYRSPRTRNREGSGLGLSIVRALGKRMGASVMLHVPKTGKGLKAIVEFQRSKVLAAA
jgi:two-component system sensor histidine kinase TctE